MNYCLRQSLNANSCLLHVLALEVLNSLNIVEGEVEIVQLLQPGHILNPGYQIVLEIKDLQITAPSVKMLYPATSELKGLCNCTYTHTHTHTPLNILLVKGEFF